MTARVRVHAATPTATGATGRRGDDRRGTRRSRARPCGRRLSVAVVVAVAALVAGAPGAAGAGRVQRSYRGIAQSAPRPDRPSALAASRAAVIIDTGSTVFRTVITFDGSISGAEALRRAGADPVFTVYAGQGAAVCSLHGVGHGPDDCFGVRSGDGEYWGYFRAVSGSRSFRYWGAGASSTMVHDGDVEGWSYGTRPSPPPYSSVAELAGDPPAGGGSAGGGSAGGVAPGPGSGSGPGSNGTPTPGTGMAGTGAPGGTGSGSSPPVAGSGGSTPAGSSPGASTGPAPSSPTATPAAGATEVAGSEEIGGSARAEAKSGGEAGDRASAAAGRSAGDGGSGGSPTSLLYFALFGAVLGGGIIAARRVRSRGS